MIYMASMKNSCNPLQLCAWLHNYIWILLELKLTHRFRCFWCSEYDLLFTCAEVRVGTNQESYIGLIFETLLVKLNLFLSLFCHIGTGALSITPLHFSQSVLMRLWCRLRVTVGSEKPQTQSGNAVSIGTGREVGVCRDSAWFTFRHFIFCSSSGQLQETVQFRNAKQGSRDDPHQHGREHDRPQRKVSDTPRSRLLLSLSLVLSGTLSSLIS